MPRLLDLPEILINLVLTGLAIVGAGMIIFLPGIVGGIPEQSVPSQNEYHVTVPEGYTAHLENPQVILDCTGAIFGATRPNSGVGGFVWMTKDGVTTNVLDLGPDKSYALGEFSISQLDGWLYFTTIEKANTRVLVSYAIHQWTPRAFSDGACLRR